MLDAMADMDRGDGAQSLFYQAAVAAARGVDVNEIMRHPGVWTTRPVVVRDGGGGNCLGACFLGGMAHGAPRNQTKRCDRDREHRASSLARKIARYPRRNGGHGWGRCRTRLILISIGDASDANG